MEQTQPLRERRQLRLQGREIGLHRSPFEIVVLAIVLIAAAFGGYLAYAKLTDLNAPPSVEATTYIPVFRSSLSSTISTTGTVQAEQEVALNFGSSGEIAQLDVEVGDTVTAGQELARLDDSQLQSALRSAQSSLASAQARLNATVSPSASDQASAYQSVLSAENQIATAQQNLDDLKAKPTADDITKAEQAVLSAQNGLQSANDALGNAQNAVTKAQSDLNDAEAALDDSWSRLGRARSDLKGAQYDCQAGGGDPPSTPGLPTKGYKADGAPYVSASLDCGDPDVTATYNKAVSTYGSSAAAYNSDVAAVEAKSDGLTSAQNTLSSGNLGRSIQSAQLGLSSAQQAMSDTLAGATPAEITAAENSLASAQASLTVAQGRYDELLHPAADTVLPLQASVDSAQDNVTQAEKNLSDAIVVAPFDGTIAAVNGAVGDQASGTAAVITLVNPDLLRIDANIDQTDISSVKVGQAATVTFDALTGYTYDATVSTVGIAPTTQSGVVTYVVSFSLDTSALPAGTPVPTPGMTASIEVTTESATDVLVVPSRSLTGSGSTRFVTVKGANGDERRAVTTGITNGTLTEVISGLEEGEEVVYTTASATSSSSSSSSQNGQFTFPGGGRGFGGGGPVIVGP